MNRKFGGQAWRPALEQPVVSSGDQATVREKRQPADRRPVRQGLAFPIDIADRDGSVVAPGERDLGSRIKRKVVDDSGMGNVKEGPTWRVTMQAQTIRIDALTESGVKERCSGSNGGTVPGQDR